MWIATRYGFFSVVLARDLESKKQTKLLPDLIMIRARQRQHLRNLQAEVPELAGHKIVSNKGTDYRYRIIAPKAVLAPLMLKLVDALDYGNFKSECHRHAPDDWQYHSCLSGMWSESYRMQQLEGQRREPKEWRGDDEDVFQRVFG